MLKNISGSWQKEYMSLGKMDIECSFQINNFGIITG
jgi:hypothetical protein